jgi:hypothetical protein
MNRHLHRNRECPMKHSKIHVIAALAVALSGCDPIIVTGSPNDDGGLRSDAPATTVASIRRREVGPEGGEISLDGLTLTVPPGALATPTVITVTRSAEAAPAGHLGYSPVWRFAPEGLTFAAPARVRVAFVGDASRAGLYRSRAGGGGYERLPGTARDGAVVADVTHFSVGFVGDELDDAGPTVAELGLGGRYTCARMTDGTVRCWGRDVANLTAGGSVALPIAGLIGVTAISAGTNQACAMIDDGTVRCWGPDYTGANSSQTTPVAGLTGVTQVSVGERHACARLADGTVRCWGDNASGQTAGSSPTSSIAGLTGVAEIGAGFRLTCARLTDGTVRCWGNNGGDAGVSTVAPVAGLTSVAQIAVGGEHACARITDGTVRCWGNNADGQLAGSSPTTPVAGLTGVVDLRAAGTYTCAAAPTAPSGAGEAAS